MHATGAGGPMLCGLARHSCDTMKGPPMKFRDDLDRDLRDIDGRGYKAYKSIRGSWDFGDFVLRVDYVQGDPFASPSRLAVEVDAEVVGLPAWAISSEARRVAVADYMARRLAAVAKRHASRRGSGKSGLLRSDRPGQQILRRTAVRCDEDGSIEARFQAGLPAKGRRVKGAQGAQMLCEVVPQVVEEALSFASLDADVVRDFVETTEDSVWLREHLAEAGLVAFVPDGALLARRTGVDDRPMSSEDDPEPFISPPSLRRTFELPNTGTVEGMGVPHGVTLIVGGGYHGKSTVLEALAMGVYDHIPGDGRELVVTDPTATAIRAEDGRKVAGVDISCFINGLPRGRSTTAFSSEDASGSTSQAAAIVEALEVGATTLLIDEDTAATNFMIRDRRMQRLIASEDEPITPFIDRARQLYEELGVSTVLVIGGSGEYFDVADHVIAMRHYRASDVTEEAKKIAHEDGSAREDEVPDVLHSPAPRHLVASSIDPSRGRKSVKISVRGGQRILFGDEELDLRGVSQLVDRAQLRAIGEAMVRAKREHIDATTTLREVLDDLFAKIARHGLDVLSPYPVGDLAAFRPIELASALNRLRTLEVESS